MLNFMMIGKSLVALVRFHLKPGIRLVVGRDQYPRMQHTVYFCSGAYTWRTFLENHLAQLVSIDFFTVPTIRFQVL